MWKHRNILYTLYVKVVQDRSGCDNSNIYPINDWSEYVPILLSVSPSHPGIYTRAFILLQRFIKPTLLFKRPNCIDSLDITNIRSMNHFSVPTRIIVINFFNHDSNKIFPTILMYRFMQVLCFIANIIRSIREWMHIRMCCRHLGCS